MSSPVIAAGAFSSSGRTPPSKQHPLVAVLRRYADHLRDYAKPLLEAAQKVQQIATENDLTQRQLIIDAIEVGCNALGDLVEETGLSEATVERIWSELIEDGEYEQHPIGLKTDMARGRRLSGLFKKGSKLGSNYSRHQPISHYHNPDPDVDL